MILILTQSFDPHADHAIEMLSVRGAEFVRFDPADFPTLASLSVGRLRLHDLKLTCRDGIQIEAALGI